MGSFSRVFLFIHLLQLVAWCRNRSPRHILGSLGEWVAAAFLCTQGFAVRARNVRVFTGEIDLLVVRDEELYAVEVRTRLLSARTDHLEQIFPRAKRRKCRENAKALSQWSPATELVDSAKRMGLLYVYVRFSRAGFPAITLFEEDPVDEASVRRGSSAHRKAIVSSSSNPCDF